MQNPLGAVGEWFRAQPEEVQKTIALLLGCLLYNKPSGDAEALERMHEWLSPKPNPLLEVGKAVQFKALFNFQLRSWVTPEGRAQVLERMKLARDVAWVETPAAVAQIEISIADRPRRDALWAKVGNSWDRLCAGPLSGQALESYLTAVLVTQANRLRR